MTLDIIVPHYREPWGTCKYLFDTIATQSGISFDDIRVLVVNDGDCLLDEENFKNYPYRIEYLPKEHGGVSAARNYGLDHATADYVMFCDIDDGFLSNYGLHVIFTSMQEGFDFLCASFIEEVVNDEGKVSVVLHSKDMTFMHGKVYRRSFMVEKNLRFREYMTLHEDGYFNTVVYSEASRTGKVKYIDTPIYLWRWNDSSVVRTVTKDFVLRTYPQLIETRYGACEELKKRGYAEDYETGVCMTVMNSYYDFQKPSYHVPENRRYLEAAEKAFRKFWVKYRDTFTNCSNGKISEIAQVSRENACKHGMLLERTDLRTFLKHIEYEVKP